MTNKLAEDAVIAEADVALSLGRLKAFEDLVLDNSKTESEQAYMNWVLSTYAEVISDLYESTANSYMASKRLTAHTSRRTNRRMSRKIAILITTIKLLMW